MYVVRAGERSSVAEALRVLRQGGIIIYPTETCYGMGCDFRNEKAKERIYRIKSRGKQKPLPTIVRDISVARRYAKVPAIVEKLISTFYPRPLTCVVSDEFAFRISSHPWVKKLVEKFRHPLVSTSANVSGAGEIYEISKIKKLFGRRVDLIVDGGNLVRRPPSTVLDVRTFTVLREGEIKKEEIFEVLKLYGAVKEE